MTTPSPERVPTEPSKASLEVAREALCNNVADTARDIERVFALALDRFRAAGVREAREQIEALTAALKNIMRVGPRPWMATGKVTWEEWEAAYASAEAALASNAAIRER